MISLANSRVTHRGSICYGTAAGRYEPGVDAGLYGDPVTFILRTAVRGRGFVSPGGEWSTLPVLTHRGHAGLAGCPPAPPAARTPPTPKEGMDTACPRPRPAAGTGVGGRAARRGRARGGPGAVLLSRPSGTAAGAGAGAGQGELEREPEPGSGSWSWSWSGSRSRAGGAGAGAAAGAGRGERGAGLSPAGRLRAGGCRAASYAFRLYLAVSLSKRDQHFGFGVFFLSLPKSRCALLCPGFEWSLGRARLRWELLLAALPRRAPLPAAVRCRAVPCPRWGASPAALERRCARREQRLPAVLLRESLRSVLSFVCRNQGRLIFRYVVPRCVLGLCLIVPKCVLEATWFCTYWLRGVSKCLNWISWFWRNCFCWRQRGERCGRV